MAQLIVRNIEEALVRKLKRRAGEHGVSVEEEHRRILREALERSANGPRVTFWETLGSMPAEVPDDVFERSRDASGRGTKEDPFGE